MAAPSLRSCHAPARSTPAARHACNGALVILQGQRSHNSLPCALQVIRQVTQVVSILQSSHTWWGRGMHMRRIQDT